jgi:hypothetical protein
MEILVIKSFMFDGKPAAPGSIIDMPVADAEYVIALKRAERIAPLPAAPVSEAAVVDAPKAPKTRKAKGG